MFKPNQTVNYGVQIHLSLVHCSSHVVLEEINNQPVLSFRYDNLCIICIFLCKVLNLNFG